MKLNSLNDFKQQGLALKSEELQSVNGSKGAPVNSTSNVWSSTMDSWNCGDQKCVTTTDFNGFTQTFTTIHNQEQP